MIRRVIAGLGRTLISIGVLLLLFVAYQLWGTGIAEARSQRSLKHDLAAELGIDAKLLDAFEQNPEVTVPAQSAPSTAPSAPTATTVAALSDITVPDAALRPIDTDPSTVRSPSTAPRVTTTSVFRSRRPQIALKPGQQIGLIRLPRIGVTKVFVEGTAVEDLKAGPGHYSGTKLPGEPGLAAIAGHRTTYGNPFFNLDQMKAGDEIIVASKLGVFRYTTLNLKFVKPSDSFVLDDKGNRNLLVLTTCHPKFSASRRLVLTAELVGPGIEADLIEPTTRPTTTVAASTTTRATTTTEPRPGVAGEITTIPWPTESTATEIAATTTLAPDAAATDISGTGGESAVPIRVSDRKFAFGWFAGPSGVWRAATLWLLACAAIWLAAWFVARRRFRVLARLGVYAGFLVPFLFALFFCYENLARLLPENI